MHIDQNRAFHYAVVASIVLHGLVLFGISQPERKFPTQAAPPIIARLMEPPAPAPAPTPVAQPPEAEAQKPLARPKPAPRKPMVKKAPAPQAEPAKAEEPPIAETPSPPEPAPAAPAVIAKVDPAPQAPAAAAAEPAPLETATPNPRSLEQYRLQLIGAARNYKRYPRVARENNWEGLVALRMVFSPSGRVASLSVTKTSGYDVLDQQAVEMFKSAAAAVPVPPVLRGKEFAVDVSVDYYFTD